MKKARILIVEDESIVAMDLKHRLENFGYTVVGHAVSGDSAAAMAEEKGPDIILMDIHLKGGIDGIETAEKIKQELDIPVLFLTAYSDQPTLERAKLTEAFGYILKPYHERELYSNIEMAMYKHKTQRAIREKEHWLNTTINSISDGVIATDRNGNIHLLNNSIEKITGLSEKELLGRSSDTVFEKISPYNDEESGGISSYYINRNGSRHPIEVSETELRDDKGEQLGKVIVLHDISERYHFEQELRTSRENAERASSAKSDFLATISHELRTPLNSILGMTEISSEIAGDNGELRENLAIIENAGKSLLTLINSILHFSQLDSKNAGAGNRESFSLERLSAELFSSYSSIAGSKGLVYRFSIEPGCPKKIAGARPAVFEVLSHLIDNALKFTEEGEVNVSCRARESEEGDADDRIWLHVLVSDTGGGLPAEIREKIFEPFTQGENIYTRRYGGAGLGLAVVKQKTEILGGKIWTETEAGRGTVFHVLLPCGVPENDFYESAYVVDNRQEMRKLSEEFETCRNIDCLEDYLQNAELRLQDNDLKGLEDDTMRVRELLDKNGAVKIKEEIFKILFACRRQDRNTVMEGIQHLLSERNK